MSGPRPSESRCFNENSPRPPVPGEERGGYQGRCQQSLSSSYQQPDAPVPSSLLLQQQQPRRTSCDANTTTTSASRNAAPLGFEPEGRSCCADDDQNDVDDDIGPKKQNMEVSCSEKTKDEVVAVVRSSTPSSTTTLACSQWTRNLRTLLEDNRGRQLFEQYLQQEGHENALAFWFACEGLKEESNLDKLSSIYKAIVRKFFQRPKLALLPEELRKEVTRRFRDGHTDKHMFEQAQQEVERLLEETSYPNFLRSELYLKCVRDCQEAKRGYARSTTTCEMTSEDAVYGMDNECPSSPDELSLSCASSLLPTLHEDSEFSSQHSQSQQHHYHQQHQQQQHVSGSGSSTSAVPANHDFAKAEMRLTKDMLMATQQYRALDVRPKPEAYAGIYLQRGASPYHASVPSKPRAQYCSYNPVSRQDSELQSLSSDARTESDNLSLTDASLSDSASMVRRTTTRKQYAKQYQQMKRSAMINRDSMPQENFIQRTQKVGRDQTQPMKPEVFANLLIEKLKRVQMDREKEERLDRKLREVDQCTNYSDSLCDSTSMVGMSMHQQQQLSGSCMSMGSSSSGLQPRNLADTLREKLQLDDDSSDQAILDQHVSRVWSDLTPSRSPKLSSPRPRSPDKCRRQQQQMMTGQLPMHQQMQIPSATARPQVYRSQRKEKDVFSTFSGDSGNVHDFPEAGELHAAGSMSSLGSHHLPKSKSVPSDYADSLHKQDLYLQGQDPRYQRLDAARSSATKKSMTELTDSGVSVVSDVPPENRRLLNWLKEGAIAGCKADATSMGGSIAVSVKPSSSRKKFSNNAPKQPFVGDAGMPLLPQPHIPTQLEEAKRRLEYETDNTKSEYEKARLERSRQRYPSASIKQQLDYEQQPSPMQPASSSCMQSSQSTLRRGRQDSPLAAPLSFTTVVFSFCEEKVPYRTKIQGGNVTLKQFKDVLPKKGSYRYFFKTECEDLDMKVIQEEITDDSEILPLWEGKIMAQVKALE